MFALNLEDLIAAHLAKTIDSVTVMSALHYLVPNAEYGFPPVSTGEVLTQEDYEGLIWLDSRPKPEWLEIENAIPLVFDLEKYIDLEQIRRLRYAETPLLFLDTEFEVSPTACALLSELIALVQETESGIVTALAKDKSTIALTLEQAIDLRFAIRQKLQQWIIDPITE